MTKVLRNLPEILLKQSVEAPGNWNEGEKYVLQWLPKQEVLMYKSNKTCTLSYVPRTITLWFLKNQGGPK